MKGDFSRSTFDRRKHYSSVLLQQGRVQLDSDWNEHLDLEVYLRQARAKDVIGYTGAPRLGGGFEVGLSAEDEDNNKAEGEDLTLSLGRLYVDGIMCENEAEVAFSGQPDFPKAALPTETGTYLAYLDVWPRHITALEDPALREIALGGPETTTRLKTVWQLRLQKVDDSVTGKDFGPDWKPTSAITNLETTGSMVAFAAKAGATPDNCLYRVEIHDDSKSSKGPTFKWSRDNGTVVGRIEDITGNLITVSMIGCQPETAFAPAQWVELSDEEHVLRGEPGLFVQLQDVQDNKLTVLAWPTGSFSLAKLGTLPTIRRWENPNGPTALTDKDIALENGVQVRFSVSKGEEYRSGDYWLFPTRAITRQVEWPQDTQGKPVPQPPHGIEHHYGRLALVKWNKLKKAFARQEDCRFVFSSLADLKELNVVQAELAAPDGAVYVDHDGNVGIGTTKPEATLEVNGAVQVSGSIKNPMWNVAQVFNMKPGPLPLTSGPWETGGGTLLIFASGSGHSLLLDYIGMSIKLDDVSVPIGFAKVYANEVNSHKTFTTNALVVTNVLAGSHTLTLEAWNNTVCNTSDFFSVTILELPFPTKYPNMVVEPLLLDFGAPAPKRVTLPLLIRNKGDAPLVISGRSINLAAFYLVDPLPLPWTIAPRSAQTLTLGLGPASNEFRQANLTIQSNDPAQPTLVIPLVGRDIHIELTPPDRLVFNDFMTPQATLVIRNSGHAPLELTKISISNSVFSILQPPVLPLIIPPQGEHRLTVQCGATGTQNGSLTIESNDPSRPTVTISLEGSMTQPPPTVNPPVAVY